MAEEQCYDPERFILCQCPSVSPYRDRVNPAATPMARAPSTCPGVTPTGTGSVQSARWCERKGSGLGPACVPLRECPLGWFEGAGRE